MRTLPLLLLTVPSLLLSEELYRNNLKNGEFGQEAAQLFASGGSDIAKGQGTSEDQKAAATPTPPKTDSSSCFGIDVEMPLIKGIVLAENSEHNIPCSDSLKESLEERFLNQPLTAETVLEIKRELLSSLQQERGSLIAVEIPKQEVSSGVLVFNILEAEVGKIDYSQTKWFSPKFYRNHLSIREGDSLDQQKLLNDVAWLNRNPFQHTEVILSPGSKEGTTDVEFVSQERFPVRFYLGVDNTGTEYTDPTRLFTGFNWGNVFGSGDMLSFQYTASPDLHHFTAYTVNYTAFLPWKHQLEIYGGYSEIHPYISDFKSSGKNSQGSLRYKIPFKPLYNPFIHELTWGLDVKNLNNNLFFSSEEPTGVFHHTINITQLMVGYALEQESKRNQLTFKIECFGSPWKWLPHQTNSAYHALRAHSSVRYFYSRLAFGDIVTLPKKFELGTLLRLQGATAALQSSEQFGLGGYDTVRGYEERIFNVDNALCFNVELRSPHLQPYKKWNDKLYFLAFSDFGWGHNYDTIAKIPSTQSLWSVGAGLRYHISTYLTARLDYGIQLQHVFEDDHFGRTHFGVVVSY